MATDSGTRIPQFVQSQAHKAKELLMEHIAACSPYRSHFGALWISSSYCTFTIV